MKVGIIGAGRQGWRRAQAIDVSRDDITFVSDIDAQAAENLAVVYRANHTVNWQDVVRDSNVDSVIVCTPPLFHAEIVTSALENGKHVLCEKPLARNLKEAQDIFHASVSNAVKLKCVFNYRHSPAIKQAKQWCDQGVIGDLLLMRCRHGIGGRQDYDSEWRVQSSVSGGGELIDQGSHVVDLFRWFMGEFSEVFGITETSYWDIEPVEDNAFGLLRQPNNRISSFHVSWTQWKNLFSLEIIGSKGSISVDGIGGSYGSQEVVLAGRNDADSDMNKRIEFRGVSETWIAEWQEFSDAIKDNREPMANAKDGLEAVRLIDALYRSSELGQPITIN